MPCDRYQVFPSDSVPQSDSAVPIYTCKCSAIRIENEIVDLISPISEGYLVLAAHSIPKLNLPVPTCNNECAAIRAKGNSIWISCEFCLELIGTGIPQKNFVILKPTNKRSTIGRVCHGKNTVCISCSVSVSLCSPVAASHNCSVPGHRSLSTLLSQPGVPIVSPSGLKAM